MLIENLLFDNNDVYKLYFDGFIHHFVILDLCVLQKRVRGNNGIDFSSSAHSSLPLPTHQNTNVLWPTSMAYKKFTKGIISGRIFYFSI